MQLMKLLQKEISANRWQIHPSAHDAYIHSTQMDFQSSQKWSQIFEFNKAFPPYAIHDVKLNKYLVYSGWVTLLPKFRTESNKISVFVCQSFIDDIEFKAWQYVCFIMNCTLHPKTALLNTADLIHHLPPKLNELVSKNSNNTQSLESLLLTYTTSPNGAQTRAPVRTAIKHFRTKIQGDDHDSN